jgi:hypothetical protein
VVSRNLLLTPAVAFRLLFSLSGLLTEERIGALSCSGDPGSGGLILSSPHVPMLAKNWIPLTSSARLCRCARPTSGR